MESRRRIVILFAALIVVWGLNWTVTKLIIRDVPPIWSIAISAAIAAGAILLAQLATGQFIVPSRQDVPVVAVVSVFHMVLFAAFMAIGLQYVSVGRSVILGYTTPIWVTPAAWLLLKEPMPRRRIAGVLLGICGILVLFNPLALWPSTGATGINSWATDFCSCPRCAGPSRFSTSEHTPGTLRHSNWLFGRTCWP